MDNVIKFPRLKRETVAEAIAAAQKGERTCPKCETPNTRVRHALWGCASGRHGDLAATG